MGWTGVELHAGCHGKGFANQEIIADKILGNSLPFRKSTHSQGLHELSHHQCAHHSISVRPFTDSFKVWRACSLATLHFLLRCVAIRI